MVYFSTWLCCIKTDHEHPLLLMSCYQTSMDDSEQVRHLSEISIDGSLQDSDSSLDLMEDALEPLCCAWCLNRKQLRVPVASVQVSDE